MPLVIWNGTGRLSAEKTLADGVEYRTIIALCNTDKIYPQCTLLNAFSASKDRKSEGVLLVSTL